MAKSHEAATVDSVSDLVVRISVQAIDTTQFTAALIITAIQHLQRSSLIPSISSLLYV